MLEIKETTKTTSITYVDLRNKQVFLWVLELM